MKAYSEDLPQKIVEATERGVSKAQAARLFNLSLSSVKRYARLARQGGSLAPGKGSGRPPKINESAKQLLEKVVQERSAATISERRRFLEHLTGESLSDSTVGRMLKRMGFSQRTDGGALERDEWRRAAWRVTVAQATDPERVVFVGEMVTNTSLSPLRAWSRRGERAHRAVPRNRGKNTTLLASMSVEGIGPSLATIGPADAQAFETYLQRVLLPELRPGRIVVMDNLSAHKTEKVRE